ncbi:MAG: GMP synthase (glutamine-hydrolyzing), partial [Deltaproteobacteria bacterium]
MERILVLDFGSQYTQLIARKVRELGVFSEIHPPELPAEAIKGMAPKGLILSGGPSSVYEPHAPLPDRGIFALGIPVLGICYGMQLMAHLLGGEVRHAPEREYGGAELWIDDPDEIFRGLDPSRPYRVWMSHGDRVERLPEGFRPLAHTSNSPYAAIADSTRKLYALQFHPEVAHTEIGRDVLRNFLFE